MSKMILCVDIDSTFTQAPSLFKKLTKDLHDTGNWEIHILTATKNPKATEADYAMRKQQLKDMDATYDDLMIVPAPIAANKAAYCRTVGVNFFIDNRPANIAAAAAVTNAAIFIGELDDEEKALPG